MFSGLFIRETIPEEVEEGSEVPKVELAREDIEDLIEKSNHDKSHHNARKIVEHRKKDVKPWEAANGRRKELEGEEEDLEDRGRQPPSPSPVVSETEEAKLVDLTSTPPPPPLPLFPHPPPDPDSIAFKQTAILQRRKHQLRRQQFVYTSDGHIAVFTKNDLVLACADTSSKVRMLRIRSPYIRFTGSDVLLLFILVLWQ